MKLTKIASIAVIGIATMFSQSALAQKIKLAHDSPPSMEKAGGYVWGRTFAQYLNDHGMEVEEFKRGALGGEAERLDQVSQGLLQVSLSAVKVAGSLDKLVFGAYLPYLFDNTEQFENAVVKGGMLEKINAGTTPKGVRVLAFYHLGLAAGLFNTKKDIHKVADAASLRFRALDEFQIELFKSWGASGTIIPFPEVTNALQTGVADGYINPPFLPLLMGQSEILTHFTDLRAVQSVRLVIASEDWYQGLSDEQRSTIADGVAAAKKANLAWLAKRGGIIDALKKAKITVITPTAEASAEFKATAEALYSTGPLSGEQVKLWIAAKGM